MPSQRVATSTRRPDDRTAARYRRHNLIAEMMQIANSVFAYILLIATASCDVIVASAISWECGGSLVPNS